MKVSWQQLLDDIYACDKCRLCTGRQNAVPGEGDAHAKLMFIGEGPGHDEDVQGRPFVGRSGELLNRMIAAIGLTREQAYICNIVKCRPPQNRNPEPDEAAAQNHRAAGQGGVSVYAQSGCFGDARSWQMVRTQEHMVHAHVSSLRAAARSHEKARCVGGLSENSG